MLSMLKDQFLLRSYLQKKFDLNVRSCLVYCVFDQLLCLDGSLVLYVIDILLTNKLCFLLK